MGFLDKQSQVIDFVLTERGRKLYAAGELDFTYFALFDDGIDYDPNDVVLSGIDDSIQATPMFEAPIIPDVRGALAALEPKNHIFTAASAADDVPRISSPVDDSTVILEADQRKDGTFYRRTGTSLAQIDLRLSGDVEPGDAGFIVRVFSSGSNGLELLRFRRDLRGRRAFDPFIAASIDDETPFDLPTVAAPESRRADATVVRRKGR